MPCQCGSSGSGAVARGFLLMGGGKKRRNIKSNRKTCCNGKCKCKCRMCKSTRRHKRIRSCTKKRCRRNNCTRRQMNKKKKMMKGGGMGTSILGSNDTNPIDFMNKIAGTPYVSSSVLNNGITTTGYLV
jgi:hypothetical protein